MSLFISFRLVPSPLCVSCLLWSGGAVELGFSEGAPPSVVALPVLNLFVCLFMSASAFAFAFATRFRQILRASIPRPPSSSPSPFRHAYICSITTVPPIPAVFFPSLTHLIGPAPHPHRFQFSSPPL
ncbi:hypothetical protein DENSPDRAFT_831778 [Dentipellis sp. KUC8613]|nr:hypothetical protein DENSPDRAFT_831778 [Dentipellis sp. KUC8613]